MKNNAAKLLLKAKFGDKNAQKISTYHTLLKLNYAYYVYVFFKDNTDSDSLFITTDKLVAE